VSDVTLRHPDLPDDQWISVPPESRAHYSPAGWQLVSDEEVAARAARAAHAVAVADATMAGLPLPAEPVPAAEVAPVRADAVPDEPIEDQPEAADDPASKPTTRKRSS
jgi:hypothetical protein